VLSCAFVEKLRKESLRPTKRDEVEREILSKVTKRNEGKPVRVNSIRQSSV
jgi:hypothetical protein